ncbi:MAG: alpha-N-arabinofuranosidase [Xanthomonadaceae bacterium]|nr:alpha-N-arabinofuranosidase [Xanthomonadaceae bacterium]
MKLSGFSRQRTALCAALQGLCAALLVFIATAASAQSAGTAHILVRADQPQAKIHPHVYGHFAEHLGRLIYDGIWVGEDSPIPNTRGIRNDVLEALKALKVPVLRWPGGCFADEYHWRDGIGPRDQRPRRVNSSWGGVDTNAFGTHEFMDLAELIGADAYININVGTGSTQEMMEWIEYMTSDSDSTLANLRRENGRDKPWKVAYVGIGNEMWGCGGNMAPEQWAGEYRKFATFVKQHSDTKLQRIAAGPTDSRYDWTEALMSSSAKHMEALSLHYYTLPTGDWTNKKGSATQFGEDQWFSTLARTLEMEEYVRTHSAIMDKYDPEKKIGLMVAEWGTWYDPEPGKDQGALYQQNTVRDAVVAGINLNIFNRHTDRVRMANIAQMVNVLQAVILTEGDKMILTPTYHVFDMYKVHQGATALPVEVQAPEYSFGESSLPGVSASASRDDKGVLHVSLVNLDPNRRVPLTLELRGASAGRVSGEVLTGATMNAMNTFERPDTVRPAPFKGVRRSGKDVVVDLPPRAVVMLRIEP